MSNKESFKLKIYEDYKHTLTIIWAAQWSNGILSN